jgi:hypothetical protein
LRRVGRIALLHGVIRDDPVVVIDDTGIVPNSAGRPSGRDRETPTRRYASIPW